MLVTGYAWLLVTPSPLLGRTTYIDENALQPSQVNTYYSWADVHKADRYLDKLEELRDRNASSEEYVIVYDHFHSTADCFEGGQSTSEMSS